MLLDNWDNQDILPDPIDDEEKEGLSILAN